MAEESTALETPQKNKRMTVDVTSIFTQSETTNHRLRVTIWADRMGLEFSKMLGPQSNDVSRCFVSFDFEKSVMLYQFLRHICERREDAHRTSKAYEEFDTPIEHSYIKDGEKHVVGVMHLKTARVSDPQSGDIGNRVVLTYEQGPESYEIILASRLVAQQVKDAFATKLLDWHDGRLYALTQAIEGVIKNWPVLCYFAKYIDVFHGGGNTSRPGVGTSNPSNFRRVGSTNPAGLSSSPSSDVDEIPF
jgi:hypothetical protein